MLALAVRAGDVPAAEALLPRRRLIDDVRAARKDHLALSVRVDRTHHVTRHALRPRITVTEQTGVHLAREAWLLLVGLAQHVEDAAQLRVGGGDLQHVAVVAVADVNVVVEVDGARRARRDASALQARLGADKHLRRDGAAQLKPGGRPRTRPTAERP